MKIRYILLVLVVVSFFSCTSKKEQAKADFTKAISEFYLNHFENSKGLFTRCIENGYQKSECYFYRGSARFNLKDYNGAIEDLTQAIKVDSAYADAYCTRGDIYTIIGKKEEGCRDWKKAQLLGKPNMRDKVKYCN